MKTHFSKFSERFQTELKTIDLDGCHFSIDELNHIIRFIEDMLEDMKKYFLSLKKITLEEEVIFFKEIKPEILGFLLYFNKAHTIELKYPNGSNDTLKNYYQGELNSLTYFFERNLDFYQYYRSKSNHLDEQYFTRHRRSHQLCLDSVHFVIDSLFSTGYDYKVAKIICNEMLRINLNKKMLGLEKRQFIDEKRAAIAMGDLKWTGPKVALIEYGYGFEASKYVNRGNADIKEIMLAFEIIFNVDLGEYYRSYYSIKDRVDRTKYLNIMMERLLEQMDKDDSK